MAVRRAVPGEVLRPLGEASHGVSAGRRLRTRTGARTGHGGGGCVGARCGPGSIWYGYMAAMHMSSGGSSTGHSWRAARLAWSIWSWLTWNGLRSCWAGQSSS